MKRDLKYFALAAAVSALAACSKEISEPVHDDTPAVNGFTAEAMATKITIDSEWKLSWEVDDAVAINDGSATYSFSADAAGSTTTLSKEGFEIDAEADYHAVFPYAAVSGFSGSTATITVAGGRTAAAGVYPSAPSVAKTTGAARSFSFQNVCGLVSFVLTESDVASIVLFGGNGEDIAGTVTVSTETGVVGEVVAGEKSILLKPAAGSAFATGRYYVAVLPGSFSGGMSISLYKTDGTRVRRNINAFTLGRSTHVDLENVDAGRTWRSSYTIKNADELQAFLELADQLPAEANVSLAADIDLAGVTLEPAASFAGTFDGAGHKLTNWITRRPLFKRLDAGGTISNLEIAASCSLQLNEESYSAASSTYTQGYLVGKNLGTVSRCTNRASLSNTATAPTVVVTRFLGLLVGENVGTISGCKNYGNINLTVNSTVDYAHHVVGGICGKMDVNSENEPATAASIASCENHGDLTVTVGTSQKTRVYLGGILGRSQIAVQGSEVNRGTLTSCENQGSVTLTIMNDIISSASAVGGVAGYLEGRMDGCTNKGDVTYQANKNNSASYSQQRALVGGVAGGIAFGASNCTNSNPVSVYGYFRHDSPAISTNNVGGAINQSCFGGVFGSVGTGSNNSSELIDNCDNDGTLTVTSYMNSGHTSKSYTGGVAGYLCIPAQNCDNKKPLTQVSLSQYSYIGGIAGYSVSPLTTCSNSASVEFDFNKTASDGNRSQYGIVAGIVGATSGSFTISGCTTSGDHIKIVKGHKKDATGSYLCGIAGDTGAGTNVVNFVSCTNGSDLLYDYAGAENSVRLRAAGIVGQTSGTLTSCTNNGNINMSTNANTNMVGGLVAFMDMRNNTAVTHDVVKNCTQNGNITYSRLSAESDTYVGGFVAVYYSRSGGAVSTYYERDPYFTGSITGSIAATNATGGVGYVSGRISYVSQAHFGESASGYLDVHEGTSVNGTSITSENYNKKSLQAGKREPYYYDSATSSNKVRATAEDIDAQFFNGKTRYVAAAE